jgi:membrane protein
MSSADDIAESPGSRTDLVFGQIPTGLGIGRSAKTPIQIPWRGWRSVLKRVFRELGTDRTSLAAAGCAFYATLALFPAISMLVSIYGLAFDPATVEPQLRLIREFLPPAAFGMISTQVHALIAQPSKTLSIGLLVSALVALWSSATGTKSMIGALNVAYEEDEKRSFLRFQLTAVAITMPRMVSMVMALALLVGMPIAFGFLGTSGSAKSLIQALSYLLLLGFVLVALSLLYRYGPSRRPPRWHWVAPGSLVATLLWLLASVLFSIYVGQFASYNATYGPIGAAAAIMMWFFVTVFVVLIGAELNAELELQTAHDTTHGADLPIGKRGAFVADHVAH